MCTNYRAIFFETLHQAFEPIDDHDLPATWPDEVYREYTAPIIIPGEDGGRRARSLRAGNERRHLPRRRHHPDHSIAGIGYVDIA